jgi:cyclic pyranopterin phosphate synthase
MPSPCRPDLLTTREITRIAAVACRSGVRKIRITGGEPLVREDIVPLIASIKQATGIRDLSITTNGILLAGLAGALKAAGLKRVNISLDTMQRDRYRAITRGGDIDRVWEAIGEAERAGLTPIKLNVVPLRGVNDDELIELASLTFDHDYHIRFIECMPTAGNGWDRRSCVTMDEVARRIAPLGGLVPLQYRGKGPSRNYRLEGARGVIGFISPVSDHFCGFCNRLRLTAAGKLRPCLFSDTGIDVRTPLRNGATDDDLAGLFARAVLIKPRGHGLQESDACRRAIPAMSMIGG